MTTGGTQQSETASAWRAAFDASLDTLPRAAWLTARREEALAHFDAIGFPTQRHEDWQHTDVRPVARTPFEAAPVPGRAEIDAAARHLADLPGLASEAARLVFVNGRLVPALSRTEAAPKGVETRGLAEALAGGPGGLEGRLTGLVTGQGTAFQALNTALWADGALVRFAPGQAVGAPVHLVFLQVSGSGGPTPVHVHPRILVVAGEGSEGRILETWAGERTGPTLQNAVSEIWLEAGARLELLELQRQPADSFHFRTTYVHQARDSRFASTGISAGARLARNDVRVHLDAPGAECRLDGLTLVEGTRHVDHQTHIVHAQPHGSSEQLYKGILDDASTTAFSGLVLVKPDAQHTDARQANHNVLLSDRAVADSKPQLEIFADDVKCAHGATVGQLDEEAIFYLRSRGLGPNAARALLLRAFAGEVPQRIADPGLRAHAESVILDYLPGNA